MITEQDLQAAIAECKGKKNPDSSTCKKLAAFLIIKEHLYPDVQPVAVRNSDSYAYAHSSNSIQTDGDTEFLKAADGMSVDSLLDVMDEMMEALSVLNPGFYRSVLRKMESKKHNSAY